MEWSQTGWSGILIERRIRIGAVRLRSSQFEAVWCPTRRGGSNTVSTVLFVHPLVLLRSTSRDQSNLVSPPSLQQTFPRDE